MKINSLNILSFMAMFCSGLILQGQNINSDSATIKTNSYLFGNFPKYAAPRLEQFSVNGFYRFVGNYRNLDIAYPHLQNNPTNLFIGDDSQIPQLMLNLSGSLNNKTSFGTDLFLWSPMTGMGQPENVKGLNLGVSLYGNFSTSVGDFNVRTGGINWYMLSPFTFMANTAYNRYSLFERNPWDPNTKLMSDRYETFYAAGAINQDLRWGQQAFQGLIVEGNNLPKGFSGAFMYGKTQLNGGLSPLPNNSIGGRIKKTYGTNFVSLNTFNNVSFTDSLQKNRIGFNVITTEFQHNLKHLQLKGEIGMGRSFIEGKENNWGEAISVKLLSDILKKAPLELHFYRISPDVINNNSIFINSALQQSALFTNNTATQPVLPAVASAIVPVGQLTNNRQGIDLNVQFNLGEVKGSLGYGFSEELSNISTQLTYGHPINSLVLAHFWRWDFPANVGPYNNLSKIYRNVYETVNLTEVDNQNLPIRKKYFNNLELNLKYKTNIFNRSLYLFYLGQYYTAQNNASATLVVTNDALLRTYYHQLESYYNLSSGIVWCNYFGYERIIANYQTQTDAISKRPKNQTGLSIATGFDIKLSKGAGLYLRQRWFDYFDSSFQRDKYKGFETTAEIKIFF